MDRCVVRCTVSFWLAMIRQRDRGSSSGNQKRGLTNGGGFHCQRRGWITLTTLLRRHARVTGGVQCPRTLCPPCRRTNQYFRGAICKLFALLTLHGRLNVTAAARLLCLSRSFASSLAGHLVDLGYVKRMRGYGDCREVYFSPTAAGRMVDATMRCRIQREAMTRRSD